MSVIESTIKGLLALEKEELEPPDVDGIFLVDYFSDGRQWQIKHESRTYLIINRDVFHSQALPFPEDIPILEDSALLDGIIPKPDNIMEPISKEIQEGLEDCIKILQGGKDGKLGSLAAMIACKAIIERMLIGTEDQWKLAEKEAVEASKEANEILREVVKALQGVQKGNKIK